MNILAVNGSPRRHWNTELLLEQAVKGAEAAATGDVTPASVSVEIVRLYPMRYSGCIGCYACKKKGDPSGLCRMKDALTPLLEKAQEADVLLVATPVYFFGESSGTRAFLERLLYAWSDFAPEGYLSRCPRAMRAGLLYTLAGTEESIAEHGHTHFADSMDLFFSLHFARHQRLFAYNTLHTEDYGKFELNVFDPVDRRRSREERFPQDCARAYTLGADLTKAIKA